MENRQQGKDRIHFLNTGYSDCILIESQGKFGLVDCAEDTEYPPSRPTLNLPGFEQEVLAYLKKNAKNEKGKVVLDFVLGTHSHSDHIGGFDTIIKDDDVLVKQAYLRKYDDSKISIYERKRWDNQEVYDQMMGALKEKNVPVQQEVANISFMHGTFKISLFVGPEIKKGKKFGDNVNSIVTLVEKGSLRAVLSGDMNYSNGGEREIGGKIGKIDLLKVGHHGYVGSTSAYWAKTLSPTYAIVTNYNIRMYPDVRFKLKFLAKAKTLFTANENGIIASFEKDKILITKNIM